MAPTKHKEKKKNFTSKDGHFTKTKQKRKWIPEHKLFQGSIQEGQGFAFQRKQRVKHEYNKLLRKEKKIKSEKTELYKEEYPEHLKHLYMAEAEKINQETWEKRVNRSKLRMKKDGDDDEMREPAADGAPTDSEKHWSLPLSNRIRKKMLKKTSFQKTKEEYEQIREKRRKKKEEFLKKQQQREEAIKKHKQKKMETYQMLSKKTKKGQPNLNFQMEFLLQKIQESKK